MSLPFTQVKYEENRGAEHHQPDLPPVRWQTVPLTLVLKGLLLNEIGMNVWRKKYSMGGKSKKGADHEVFATEDDPETEERWVEDALLNVLKQQHPGPLGAQGEPLHGYVQEHHGDAESKNHPVQGEWVTLKKNWLLKDQQLCAAGTVSTWFQQADFALWIEHFSFPLLSTWPPEALCAS